VCGSWAGRYQGGLKRLAINGGLKVRVMVVVSFLVGENKREGDDSLPCVTAQGGRGEAERHKTGHLGVGR
jgi:hypothetical protein